jgi:serine protease inhibitor
VKRMITPDLALFVGALALQGAPLVSGQVRADAREVVTANTAFAADLYAKLKNEKGNLFFSPYSISTALAMTLAGARGDTGQQMANVLHFAVLQGRLHPTFAALETELNAVQMKGKVQLSVANSLWPQRGHPFLPEYVGLLQQYYGASVTPLDYAGAAEAARKTINDWVERETDRKIIDLIKPGVLGRDTLLVLANAVYFKGNWVSQFDPKRTTKQPFRIAPGNDVKCPSMTREGTYAYAETPDLQMMELPYAGNDLSMLVLLPRKIDGIGVLENELSAAKLTEWVNALHKREVMVSLPKFKLTCEFGLAKTLAAMGMTAAFNDGADFSGMDGTRSLFVSAVIHKAFVDVNEEGTEATAATAVAMPCGPVTVFRVDHPFIFLIRDKHNDSILFLGRVTDPTA